MERIEGSEAERLQRDIDNSQRRAPLDTRRVPQYDQPAPEKNRRPALDQQSAEHQHTIMWMLCQKYFPHELLDLEAELNAAREKERNAENGR